MSSNHLYVVGVRWAKTAPDGSIIERVIDSQVNWARLNIYTWLVWTDKSATDVADLFRKPLATEDSVFVIEADRTNFAGWAPQMIWDWLYRLGR